MRRALSFMCALARDGAVARERAKHRDQNRRCRRVELAAKPHVLVELVRRHAERRVHVLGLAVAIRADGVRKKLDWQVEFAVPALVNMPTSAVMPAPFGQLGLGGSYAAANSGSTNSSSIFLKQGELPDQGHRRHRRAVDQGRPHGVHRRLGGDAGTRHAGRAQTRSHRAAAAREFRMDRRAAESRRRAVRARTCQS